MIRRFRFRSKLARMSFRTAVLASVTAILFGAVGSAAEAATYVPISGTGSTWSQNALDQWRKNVASNYGMTVNYSGNGSSAGRRDFIQDTVDFAVSEIPFQAKPEDGSPTEVPTRGYAYMPIVAGGTSLMYNLKIGGKRVTNLRLSGDVIAKIFSGKITKWDDAAIKADNPGLAMPSKTIVPVVRSDGSGSTAQFTKWMSEQYSSIWSRGMTSQFPSIGGFKYQSGSNGVAGYVSQNYGEGAITYVEYSYAVESGFPVAKVLNKAGYYIEPTAESVAVALLSAGINSDLTQVLTGVYNSADARTYPLSSYSYMIVPTDTNSKVFTKDKGATLGAFTSYMLCEGQQQAKALGYSPLPINLVKAGFQQIARIPGSGSPAFNESTCNNPAFKIVNSAPQPAACDKQGPNQCTTGTAGAAGISTAITGTGAGGAASEAAGGAGADALGAGGTDATAAGYGGGGATGGASPFTLNEDPWGGRQYMLLIVGLLIVGAVLAPPFLIRRFWHNNTDSTPN